MPKVANFLAATTLAFSSILLSTPANADWVGTNANLVNGSVQFDYRGGSATQTLTVPDNAVSASVRLTVDNTIANRIGGGELADTWSVSVNDTTVTGNTIESRVIELPVTGSVRLTVSGIDSGFWAGWYGPIFSAPEIVYTLPVATPWFLGEAGEGESREFIAPDGKAFDTARAWYGSPTDETCGADVSGILTGLLAGKTSQTVALDNGTFGDPCGGVVKVTRWSWTTVDLVPVIAPLPEPSPTPSPTIEPSPQPTVTPDPQPEPRPEPQPEPQPRPQPNPEPTPEPTPEPSPTPEPPKPLPIQSPAPLPPVAPEAPANPPATKAPSPPLEIAPAPKPLPLELPDKEEIAKPLPPPLQLAPETINPETLTVAEVQQLTQVAHDVLAQAEPGSPIYEQALEQLLVVAEADDPELPEELTALPLIGGVASAVFDGFNAIGNIGADMSPKQREQAKKEVIASIAIGQAVMASSVVSYRRGV